MKNLKNNIIRCVINNNKKEIIVRTSSEGIFNIEKNVVIIVIKKKYFNFTKMLSFNFDYIMEYKYNCYTYENKKIVCKEVKESESPF